MSFALFLYFFLADRFNFFLKIKKLRAITTTINPFSPKRQLFDSWHKKGRYCIIISPSQPALEHADQSMALLIYMTSKAIPIGS